MGYCESVAVDPDTKVTIVDLCSGKGHLSMLLGHSRERE